MKAKQIEWSDKHQSLGDVVGKVGNHYLYTIDHEYVNGVYGWLAEQQVTSGYSEEVTFELSPDQAKQACQDHLQQYVDGLLLQLQQLTTED